MPAFPRRFRRPLLLPLGWVALGLLLPLSCWLLGRQLKQWHRGTVVQVTMPPLRPIASAISFYRARNAGTPASEYNLLTDVSRPDAPARLARLRPWHDFALTGERVLDSAKLLGVEAAVRAIQADTGHAGGVRVRMGRQVAYRQLVALLDMMSRLNQRRYWLDIVHQPTTFYVITPRPPTLAERREVPAPIWVCGGGNDCRQLPAPESRLASLRQPGRRPQQLLTLAVAALLLAALAGTLSVALGTRR